MIFLFIVLGLVLIIYLYLTWNFDYWSKRGVPSAKAKVLLGNLPNSMLGKEHFSSDFDKLYGWVEENFVIKLDRYQYKFSEFKPVAPFVGIIQVRSPRLLIFQPELVKDVLIRKFKHFHDNEFGDTIDKKADPLFARNPFFLQGEEWKEKRAEISPAFSPSRLKALFPVIVDVQGRMVKYIKEKSSAADGFDARELCAQFSTDVVANAIFGVDGESFTKENPEIREMGRRLLSQRATFIFKMFLVSAMPILKRFINMKFTTEEIENFFVDLVEQALKYREKNKIQREDFLNFLLQLQKKRDIKSIDMTAHTITFLTDGFDTSSIAMSHALYEVSLANSKFYILNLLLFADW